MSATSTPGERLVTGALLLTLSIALGWIGGFAWRERTLIARLWLDASEQRYLTMTGDVGPVTYLVTHADPRAFARDALALEGVLGVEPYDYPRLSAIAFENGESAAIERVGDLPGVSHLQRRHVPMICH